jgi:polyphosphate glucokinase
MRPVLGIDVGASGIKGGLVDLESGMLSGDRLRIPTPQPATPAAIREAYQDMIQYFQYEGPVGVGFPAIIKQGKAMTAANIDESWVGVSVAEAFDLKGSNPIVVTNDADAAGVAEMHYGEGKGEMGLVIMLTIGTGIGSALFHRGQLIPNTELGHLIWKKGIIAEQFCSSGARERLKMGRAEWAKRFNAYLLHLERIFSPDLFILGGGESKRFDDFSVHLRTRARVVSARLLNNAGIIGAAVFAGMRADHGPVQP